MSTSMPMRNIPLASSENNKCRKAARSSDYHRVSVVSGVGFHCLSASTLIGLSGNAADKFSAAFICLWLSTPPRSPDCTALRRLHRGWVLPYQGQAIFTAGRRARYLPYIGNSRLISALSDFGHIEQFWGASFHHQLIVSRSHDDGCN